MPEIEPLSDAYIDGIIKASSSSPPNSGKTRGVELRELVKNLRDYYEQKVAKAGRSLSVAYFRAGNDGPLFFQLDELVNATSIAVFRGTPQEVIHDGDGELYLNDQVLVNIATGKFTFKLKLEPAELVTIQYIPAYTEPEDNGNTGFTYTFPITL